MAKIRGQYGQFAQIGDSPRSVRSLRLTDETWATLEQVAQEKGATRADLVEELATTYYTVSSDNQPGNTREGDEELQELREWKARAEKELTQMGEWQEQMKQLRQANLQNDSDLDRAVKRMVDAEASLKRLREELATVKREKEELDRECNKVHEKHGDALNEIELLKEQPASQPPAPAIELAELAVAVSKVNGKRPPKAKIKLDDVREILKLVGVEV